MKTFEEWFNSWVDTNIGWVENSIQKRAASEAWKVAFEGGKRAALDEHSGEAALKNVRRFDVEFENGQRYLTGDPCGEFVLWEDVNDGLVNRPQCAPAVPSDEAVAEAQARMQTLIDSGRIDLNKIRASATDDYNIGAPAVHDGCIPVPAEWKEAMRDAADTIDSLLAEVETLDRYCGNTKPSNTNSPERMLVIKLRELLIESVGEIENERP